MKIIKEELLELTETYQKNVLERTDELEQLVHMDTGRSKEFAKQILNISQLIPPKELEDRIKNLENEIRHKLDEMKSKIKNLKSKKKKKAEKKNVNQRYDALSYKLKLVV